MARLSRGGAVRPVVLGLTNLLDLRLIIILALWLLYCLVLLIGVGHFLLLGLFHLELNREVNEHGVLPSRLVLRQPHEHVKNTIRLNVVA